MEHCLEKSRLADEFARAAETYANAAKQFREALTRSGKDPMGDLERTRIDCSKARRALQAHIIKHRCYGVV